MKDVWLFVKWQCAKLETWQIVFLINFFLMGFTAFRTDEMSKAIFTTTLLVPFMFMIKWFVIDSIAKSWNKFKQEKDNLFNVIRDSEK